MKKFKDLNVWGKAMELVKSVSFITKKFPEEERFGLTSQIRRSVASIPSNGSRVGKDSDKEFNHFLNITKGSTCELETQLIIAAGIGLLAPGIADSLYEKLDEIQRMITNLQKKL